MKVLSRVIMSLIICSFFLSAYAEKKLVTDMGEKYKGRVIEETFEETEDYKPDIKKKIYYYNQFDMIAEIVEIFSEIGVNKLGATNRVTVYNYSEKNPLDLLTTDIIMNYPESYADKHGSYCLQIVTILGKDGKKEKMINFFTQSYARRKGIKYTISIFDNNEELVKIKYYNQYGAVKGVENIK